MRGQVRCIKLACLVVQWHLAGADPVSCVLADTQIYSHSITHYYAAPEVRQAWVNGWMTRDGSEGFCPKKADVYSVGVSLIQLATGGVIVYSSPADLREEGALEEYEHDTAALMHGKVRAGLCCSVVHVALA